MPTYTGTIQFYQDFSEQLGKKAHNLHTDTLKMLLVTSSYTFSAAHATVSDITNEVSTNGYARQTVANQAWTETTGTGKLDFDDPVFSASGGNWTARRWVLFNDTHASDALICSGLINNADADVVCTDGNSLTFVVPGAGLFTMTLTGA